jgi:hypothetical protein
VQQFLFTFPRRRRGSPLVGWYSSLGEKPRQFRHGNRIEFGNGLVDIPSQWACGIGFAQALKFLHYGFPPHRSCVKSFIIRFFLNQLSSVLEVHGDTTRHLVREALAQLPTGLDGNTPQEALHVRAGNAIGMVLLGHQLTIQDGDGKHVGQAVVRRFFGADDSLITLFSSADDVAMETSASSEARSAPLPYRQGTYQAQYCVGIAIDPPANDLQATGPGDQVRREFGFRHRLYGKKESVSLLG